MKTIAFICTGNTCRSPMAEHIMKDLLAKRQITGYAIQSFGIYAVEDSPISALAATELKNRGISDVNHRAKRLTEARSKQCDLMITMTKAHLAAINYLDNAKSIDDLTSLGDIADPYGGSAADYRACAKQIEGAVNVLIDKLAIIFDNSK